MNSPPAFPSLHWVALQGHSANENPQGMSLRDYFAAKAMQALIDNDGLFSEIPTQAYALADAMLAARENK